MPSPRPEGRSVDIAQVLREAEFGRLQWLAEERAPYDRLHDATAWLFDLLDERIITFVLVGGLAMLQYVDGRNTSDIDLILALSDLDALPEIDVLSRDRDFARGSFYGVQLDFLLTTNALFEHVREQYTTMRDFNGRELRCATVEGLLVLKLYALPSLYRQGDFGRSNLYESDIAALTQAYEPDIDVLVDELVPYLLKTDIDAIRDIVRDIKQRIARFEASDRDANPPTPPTP